MKRVRKSKPAVSSFWSCLPHPEVEFLPKLVTFLSSLITLPAVVALHPVAIALMIMAPVRNKMSQIMVVATAFTALTFGCVDALHILGYMPSSTDEWMGNYMPLYNDFASWIVPSVFMMIVGLLFTTKTNQTEQFELVNE